MTFLFVLYPAPSPSSVVAFNTSNLTTMVVVKNSSLADTGVAITDYELFKESHLQSLVFL